jgi:hypothetical protein
MESTWSPHGVQWSLCGVMESTWSLWGSVKYTLFSHFSAFHSTLIRWSAVFFPLFRYSPSILTPTTSHVSRVRSHYTAGIIIYGRPGMPLRLSSFKSRYMARKRIFALIRIIFHGYGHTAVTAVTLASVHGFALAGTYHFIQIQHSSTVADRTTCRTFFPSNTCAFKSRGHDTVTILP